MVFLKVYIRNFFNESLRNFYLDLDLIKSTDKDRIDVCRHTREKILRNSFFSKYYDLTFIFYDKTRSDWPHFTE